MGLWHAHCLYSERGVGNLLPVDDCMYVGGDRLKYYGFNRSSQHFPFQLAAHHVMSRRRIVQKML